MDFVTYIAYNAPERANQVLRKYNMPVAQNLEELEMILRRAISDFGDEFTADLLQQHPDMEVLQEITRYNPPSGYGRHFSEGEGSEKTEKLSDKKTEIVSQIKSEIRFEERLERVARKMEQYDTVLKIAIVVGLVYLLKNKD